MSEPIRQDFWTWSVKCYGGDGVEPVLLKLQDEFDLNVNILLWCCWCAERFPVLPDIAIRKAMDLSKHWAQDVSGALRRARRSLKTPPPEADADAADALRRRIKEAELAAERIEQTMYETLALMMFEDGALTAKIRRRARRNLATYVALSGAARKTGFTMSLMETLIDRIFPCAEEAGASPAKE
ncbi:MAG: TIGR02444 family protein [Parvularculaceae bacterium]